MNLPLNELYTMSRIVNVLGGQALANYVARNLDYPEIQLSDDQEAMIEYGDITEQVYHYIACLLEAEGEKYETAIF